MLETYKFVFNCYNYDVSDLEELELARFKFYKNSNWSLYNSKSIGLEESQAES